MIFFITAEFRVLSLYIPPNIVVETLLINIQRDGVQFVGYANDQAILISGIDPQTLSKTCNQFPSLHSLNVAHPMS